MIRPFVYPRDRHKRVENPPSYKNPSKFKPYLRREFSRCCVYCRMPDGLAGQGGFSVDHYRPRSKFPELLVSYSNLYYACSRCNTLKRDYWPDARHKARGVFVPNPCDHFMVDHVRFDQTSVTPSSLAGQWTVDLLRLNEAEAVDFRRFIVCTVRLYRHQLADLSLRLDRLAKEMNRAEEEDRRRELEAAAALLKQQVSELKSGLQRLGVSA